MNLEMLSHLLFKDKFKNLPWYPDQPKAYYGNVCNMCFCSKGLKKCSSCKWVSYCSKEHQKKDWSLHKHHCNVLKKADAKVTPIEGISSFEDFKTYREKLALEMKSCRPLFSKQYEREIKEFLWVCAFCFTKNNLSHECENCKAVVYCSLEHMQEDAEGHQKNCYNLKLCKLFDSLLYENGFKLKIEKFVFEEIPRNVKAFPATMDGLSNLIQKQIREPTKITSVINYIIHNDIYAPAATILYGLETIGVLYKRVLTTKPFLTKRQHENRLAERVVEHMMYSKLLGMPELEFETDPAMVIHFVGCDNYEIDFQWPAMIGLLTHWMINIDYLNAILVGPALERCDEPDFSTLVARSGFECYPTTYKSVIRSLEKPDLIVLYNYGSEKENCKEFDDYESKRALFKYKRVPLVITCTKESLLKSFVDKLLELPYIQVQVDTCLNPFSESRPRRIWDEKNISTYMRNQYIAVLTRH